MNDSRQRASRRSKLARHGLVRMAVLSGVVYFGILTMFAGLQRKLIYVPRKGDVPLAAAGIPVERISEVLIPAPDDILLHGWMALAEPEPITGHRAATGLSAAPITEPHADPAHGERNPDALDSPSAERPLVILFPGNAGNRSNRAALIQQFNVLGCDVLAVDYRGYAENDGAPSEEALAADAWTIWEYARETLAVPAERIVLYGQSLGGGVATRLAWDLKQNDVTPGGLILKATFTSLVDAGRYNYPWLPVRLVLVDRYPSIERIGVLECPILVVHGKQDRIIPFKQGQELFDAAPTRSTCGIEKQFIPLPQAGHNDIMTVAGPHILDAHGRFLSRLRERNGSSTPLTHQQ